jgi:hypothetical protein
VRRAGATGLVFELRCTYCGAWKVLASTEQERDALAHGHAEQCPAAKRALETRHKARELATPTSRAESWTREHAWWLHNNRRFLTNHPPRIPPPEDCFSPSAQPRAPHGVPTPPCIDKPTAITRYALEVLDAPLLYDLLHLWSLAEEFDKRFFFSKEGSGWRSATIVAGENVASAQAEVSRLRKLVKLEPERASELVSAERRLKHCRDERDESPLKDKQIARERLYLLVDILHTRAGWTYRDIAKLIVASEHDWTRPPIHRIRNELRARGEIEADGFVIAVEEWIDARLGDEARNSKRQTKPKSMRPRR